jgi:hypothetical protein
MDPVGQHEFWYGTMNDARLTVAQRLWIAGRVKPVAVGDE